MESPMNTITLGESLLLQSACFGRLAGLTDSNFACLGKAKPTKPGESQYLSDLHGSELFEALNEICHAQSSGSNLRFATETLGTEAANKATFSSSFEWDAWPYIYIYIFKR